MTITKDSSISFPSRYKTSVQDAYPDGTVASTWSNESTRTVKCKRTRTGTRCPKWKAVIASGGDATTPLSGVEDEIFNVPVSCTHKWRHLGTGNTRTYTTLGDAGYALLPVHPVSGEIAIDPLMDTSVADNRARARFYKKLRQTQVQFSGPTFLGELRETLRMIKRPAQAIRDSCDRYGNSLSKWKGRNRPPAKSHDKWNWRQELQKVAGGLWLENSFGWQPLLNDIKDAVSAYERLTPRVANSLVISVGDTDAKDAFSAARALGYGDEQEHTYIGDMYFNMHLERARTSCTVRYKGKVSTPIEATRWDNLALFGFTPSEFIPTAWELLPWSFLIDYFTNIGDILTSAVTKSAAVNYVTRTIRTLTVLDGHLLPVPKRPGGQPWDYELIENRGSRAYEWHTRRKSLSRSPGGGVPLPVISFEPGLNIGQMCNITALMTNFIDIHPQDKPKRNWHR